MTRNFASFSRSILRSFIAAGLMAGCSATGELAPVSETESALAAVVAAQEGLGELEEQGGGCLEDFAACVADGGEDCHDALKACAPKPPKLEKLKEAVKACKAGEAPPAMSTDELAGSDGEAAGKPGGGKPPKNGPPTEGAPESGDAPPPPPEGGDAPPPPPEGGDAPPPPPEGGDAPPTAGELPEGELPDDAGPNGGPMKAGCGKIMKAAGKAKAKCEHHQEVVKACIDDLDACVTDGGVPADCATEARDCLKSSAEAAFAKKCEEKLAHCEESDAPAELCEKIAAHCAEGPKAPPAPGDGEAPAAE